jgi:signal transduction histidine kinase/CheY-like chemotaxis protein
MSHGEMSVEQLRAEIERLRIAERRGLDLMTVDSIANAVGCSLELQDVVDMGLAHTLACLGFDGGAVCLFDSSSGFFVPAASQGISENVVEEVTAFSIGEGMAGKVAESRQPLVVPDLAEAEDNSFPAALADGMHCFAGIPITRGEQMLAVMTLFAADPGGFGVDRTGLLAALGTRFGMAIANAQVHRQSKNEILDRMVGERQQQRIFSHVQEHARQVQQLVDAVPDGLILLDGAGRVLLANSVGEQELASLSGAKEGDVITQLGNRPLADLLQHKPAQPWSLVTAGERRVRVRVVPLGEEYVMREEESREGVESWVLVLRDAAEVAAGPQLAPHMERLDAMGQMSAALAERLDTMMAVIALYGRMLLRTPGLDADLYERLSKIDQHAELASALVQKIQDFGAVLVNLRPLDMQVLVKELTESLQHTFSEDMAVELEHGSDDYGVRADAKRIRQALMNVAMNAWEAMPEGGTLHITLARVSADQLETAPPGLTMGGDWVQVQLADSGRGIRPDVLPHIFTPFFTTKPPGLGTGLGLSQTYGIVARHGGHVDVTTQEDEGTTVTVRLPALPAEDGDTRQAASVPEGEGETVLVVERDPSVRDALVDALQTLGYQTMASTGGPDALMVLGHNPGGIQVVLAEADLSDVNAEMLRHNDPSIKIVLSRPRRAGKQPPDSRWRGVDRWIDTPPQLEQLAAEVASALGRT